MSVEVSADAMMPVYLAEQYHLANTRKDWGCLLPSFCEVGCCCQIPARLRKVGEECTHLL